MEPGLPTARRDVKPDRDNLRYGGLEKSTIPRYRLAGRGHIIGLGRTFQIRPGSSGARVTVAIGADSSRRQRHDSLLSPVPQPGLNLISEHDISEHPVEQQANYISIRSRKRRRLSGPEHPFSIIDNPVEDGLDQSSATTDEDSDDPNPTDAYEAFQNDRSQQRHRELLKKTTLDPQDTEAWLALIEHQEDLVRPSDADSQVLSATQRRTLAELRVALFETALSKVVDPEARQRLIRGLLQEGAKIWDHTRQTTEWRNVLSNDASFELRVLHLNFLVSSPWTFSYERCLNTIGDYLGIHLSELPSKTRDEHIVYLLLRATLLMKQAGYVEHAVAIWQANLELNFFFPDDGDGRTHESSFEDFWDSELPRLGEAGATGWNAPPSSATVPDASTGTTVLPLRSQMSQNPSPQHSQPDPGWAAAERNAQRFWPARTMDDVDDPYVIALFTDIHQYIFRLSTNETKTNLLDAFLCFNGFPPIDHGYRDIDIYLCQLEAPRPSTGVVDSTSLFAAKFDPSAAFHGLESSDHCSLVSTAVRQLAQAQSGNDVLAEYAVALELAVNPANARKFAKRLLKQRPESSRLYNAYALVECGLEHFAAAEKVWATTIRQKAIEGQSIPDQLLMYHAWIWEAMLRNQPSKVGSLLAHLADAEPDLENIGGKPSNAGRDWSLQTSEEFMRAQLFKAYSQNIWSDLVVCIDLLVFLQYYILDRNLHAALATYEQMLSMTGLGLDSGANRAGTVVAAVERIHSHRARLIQLHTSTPGLQFRPKDVVATLRSSCQIFPNNPVLRQLTRGLAQKHGSIDRLRDATALNMPATALKTSPIEHFLGIENEMARDAAYGGTEHGIRAAFQKAKSEDSPVRSCPAIQLGHLRWELSLLRSMTTQKKPGGKKAHKQQVQRVKGAFSQAVAACPWVKEIYLTYFDESLQGAVDDWQEAYEAMLERGLRVYIEVQP